MRALLFSLLSASVFAQLPKPGSNGGGGGGGTGCVSGCLTGIAGTAGGPQTGPAITFALGTSGTANSIAGSGNTLTFNFPPFVSQPFLSVYTSSTILTLASNCAAAPLTCQARFGNTSTQIAASGTCTISAGSGTMFEYIATDGRVKCGSNGLTLVCSAGCDVTTSITAFPATSIPLYSWTATSGTWDVSGSSDWRAVLSAKNIACGTNATCVDSGGLTTISASGSGATIPSVTNVIKGDGAGNGADTKVAITSPTTAGNLTFGTDNATLTLQGTGTVVNRDSTDTLTNKTFGQTVLPSTDSIYNLGSGSFYWAGVYSLNGNFFTSFAKGYQIYGQQFTASGCSNGTLVGGSTAGSYLSGTSGTCTVTVTMGGSQTATTQWACHASNVTTTSNVMVMTTSNTTTATFSGVTVSGDKIVWSCLGF